MASIKPIEGASVHKIQSGQVIVGLSSVVKELVENSLDAGATAIEVRFKNHGLDAIEVQDNGLGIAEADYETVALKHYTSKLSNYDDLGTLQTFGFRGEALSSLCAVSKMYIVTARDNDAPKGTRLDFESSGRLKGIQVVASQRGTTVVVETIFTTLPVRRQELEKNIKREYNKVLGLLQAYACITTSARITVSNAVGHGKRAVAFSTKSNQTTRDNIANIFGAKTLPALIPLDLDLELQPSGGRAKDSGGKQVRVVGHVSKPVFGEGRQTPDRQMFFVNGRPCGLPQVAKVFNEVYKSYNLSQSPFIFADVILDTNAYDVNVSPDKRAILLHDQGTLLESIKTSLTKLFESQQQTVPQSQKHTSKLPDYKPLAISRQSSKAKDHASPKESSPSNSGEDETTTEQQASSGLTSKFASRNAKLRRLDSAGRAGVTTARNQPSIENKKSLNIAAKTPVTEQFIDQNDEFDDNQISDPREVRVRDFNRRLASQVQPNVRPLPRKPSEPLPPRSPSPEEAIRSLSISPAKPSPGVVQSAFDRMRPQRAPAQTATITIGSKTIVSEIGSSSIARSTFSRTPVRQIIRRPAESTKATPQFTSALRLYAAPGTQIGSVGSDEDDEDEADSRDRSASHMADRDTLARSDRPREGPVLEALRKVSAENAAEEDSEESVDSEGANEQDVPKPPRNENDSDEEYLDDATKKAREEAKVAQLIRDAEAQAATPTKDNLLRAQKLLKGGGKRESTTQLIQNINISTKQIITEFQTRERSLNVDQDEDIQIDSTRIDAAKTAEDRLSLTVSKGDFASMRIIGQFNLGFIIALRPAHPSSSTSTPPSHQIPTISSDELFIIDQHASDEKYNFERLQATTVVQNQRLVHPQPLDLTAIEEEIILENQDALIKNGFLISIDESGEMPVGRRCSLVSLPMSREVTFSTLDLEELLVLLAESTSVQHHTPRPSSIRRMLAMRACRSSVMIGKTLTKPQMARLVGHMGELEKPWNCPHGRPTMRHLIGLAGWRPWMENSGMDSDNVDSGAKIEWREWLQGGAGFEDETESEGNGDEGEEAEVLGEDGDEDIVESKESEEQPDLGDDEGESEEGPSIAKAKTGTQRASILRFMKDG